MVRLKKGAIVTAVVLRVAKRENGRLRQFNLSLLVTDEFMQAVREDKEEEKEIKDLAAESLKKIDPKGERAP